MVTMYITRFKETSTCTIGSFMLLDEDNSFLQQGFTLEPRGPSTSKAGMNKRVPEGVYETKMRLSPTFKEILPLLWNDEVPAHRFILIHAGNCPKDTRGCILIGETLKDDYVLKSRSSLNQLKNNVGNKEFRVEIKYGY